MTVSKIIIIFTVLITTQFAQANDIGFKGLNVSSYKNSLNIALDEINVPHLDFNLTQINYQCHSSIRIYPVHECENGRISFIHLQNQYQFNFIGWINLKENSWDIKLTNDDENLVIYHESVNKNSIKFKLNQTPIAELSKILKNYISIDNDQIQGTLTAELNIDFNDQLLITGNYQLNEFNYESESSEYILAETSILGEFMIRQISDGYEFKGKNSIDSGEGLFKDIYLLFEKDMIVMDSYINFNNQFNFNDVALNAVLSDVINIDIDEIDLDNLSMIINFDVKDMSILYNKYLLSYFEIIGVNDAEFDGIIKGEFNIVNGDIESVQAGIHDMFAEIESKKIEINNLNSNINWSKKGDLKESNFKWDALLLAGMPINQSQLELYSAGQNIKIKEGTQLPIFDGSLDIYQLNLKDIFEPEISIQFDGEVQPISLSLIAEKMDWPIMNGYISGKIPGMKKVGHRISFDGLLELTVFDGTMQIDNLTIERLFGIAPVVAANITFQNLSLLSITSTYDFGDISGRVNGYVKGMRITNWKADRLNAYIESVKTKGVKQSISQRAIDNISSIGGIQGALSRSFLRFFDAFRYKRLGIGCKLRNSICEMKGLDTTAEKYQIVSGKGLPSINIFGYSKFIDWQVLLDRLFNANY